MSSQNESPREHSFTEPEIQILEAFIALCRQHGVGEVTLQMVAKASKTSFGKVHYYFGGKNRNLTDSAILYVGTNAQKHTAIYLEESLGEKGFTRLDTYVNATFDWVQKCPNHSAFWVYYYYLTSIKTKHRGVHASFLSRARNRIGLLIYESIGRKEIPTPSDTQRKLIENEFLLRIHDIIIGGMILAMSDPQPDAIKKHHHATLASIRSLLNDLFHT